MSRLEIRAALEQFIAANTSLPTAFEGVSFTPDSAQPYQRVYLLMNQPQNPTMGQAFYRETGFFQITLCYPVGNGTGDINTEAERLRRLFIRGRTWSTGGVTILSSMTPQIGNPIIDGDHMEVVVRVFIQADVFE